MKLLLTVSEMLQLLHAQAPLTWEPAKTVATDRSGAAGATGAMKTVMKITRSVMRDIMCEIGKRDPESGGVIIGPAYEPLGTNFVFDETGICTGASWTFGHVKLNEILRKYLPLGFDAKGYVHSHPAGYRRLSPGDMLIPQKAFANQKNEDLHEVWMPILVDGDLLPFIVYRDNPKVALAAELVIV